MGSFPETLLIRTVSSPLRALWTSTFLYRHHDGHKKIYRTYKLEQAMCEMVLQISVIIVSRLNIQNETSSKTRSQFAYLSIHAPCMLLLLHVSIITSMVIENRAL